MTSYETFQRTTEDLALFCNMYASIPDEIQQEIISNVGDVFYMFYHIVLLTCWTSIIQHGGFFVLEPSVMACQLLNWR